jgi:hypothetical protein
MGRETSLGDAATVMPKHASAWNALMVVCSQSMLAHHADPVAARGPDEGLEKHNRVRGVEKPTREEPSGQRFLAWIIGHLS